MQTWAALRAQGIRTPEVAAWQRVPLPPATLATTNKAKVAYTYVLKVYNEPAYQQVLLGTIPPRALVPRTEWGKLTAFFATEVLTVLCYSHQHSAPVNSARLRSGKSYTSMLSRFTS